MRSEEPLPPTPVAQQRPVVLSRLRVSCVESFGQPIWEELLQELHLLRLVERAHQPPRMAVLLASWWPDPVAQLGR